MEQTKIKPINPKLRGLLEEWLLDPEYQDRFAAKAKELGYLGTDPDMIRVALFTPADNGEICFVNKQIEDLFVEFQIKKALKTVGVDSNLDKETMAQMIDECRGYLEHLHTQDETICN